MGHIRLGNLPRTRKWQQVVALLDSGAATDQVAAATLDASKRGLEEAARDPALVHSFWLLTQLPLCARAEDFVAALNRAGITVTSTPPLLELVGGFADAVDDHVRKTGGRTDLAAFHPTVAVNEFIVDRREAAGEKGRQSEYL
jgi:hypothetical protein